MVDSYHSCRNCKELLTDEDDDNYQCTKCEYWYCQNCAEKRDAIVRMKQCPCLIFNFCGRYPGQEDTEDEQKWQAQMNAVLEYFNCTQHKDKIIQFAKDNEEDVTHEKWLEFSKSLKLCNCSETLFLAKQEFWTDLEYENDPIADLKTQKENELTSEWLHEDPICRKCMYKEDTVKITKKFYKFLIKRAKFHNEEEAKQAFKKPNMSD